MTDESVDTLGRVHVVETTPQRPAETTTGVGIVALFTLTSFSSAFLLFLVQPMVAKLVLPTYGGAPAVWNTAMVFFQGALLAGYGYAHLLTQRLAPKRQAGLHLAVLAAPLLLLPLTLPGWAEPGDRSSPAVWLLLVLVVVIGAPFLVVSTTGPLLQRWFSLTDHPRANDPYFLFAAGNAGSFLALLGYPLVVEPAASVTDQVRLWSYGYVGVAVLIATCGVLGAARARPLSIEVVDRYVPVTRRPSRRTKLTWLGLAALPSSLMLGVTTHVTTEVAAVPMLWVAPLAVYLLTFIVAFGPRADRPIGTSSKILAGTVAAAALSVVGAVTLSLTAGVVVNLVAFSAAAYVAHRRLALLRPHTDHLTSFYLVVAAGGVVGGALTALLAPVLFNRVVEYPLALAIGGLLVIGPTGGGPVARRYGRLGTVVEAVLVGPLVAILVQRIDLQGVTALFVVVGLAALAGRAGVLSGAVAIGTALALVATAFAPNAEAIHETRSFFGVSTVQRTADRTVLIHGATIHGVQALDPALRGEPQSYYHRDSPIGQVFADLSGADSFDRVGVVGLGVGALAAYGEPGDEFTFFEIDPEVVRIANDPAYFTYLADSDAEIDVVIGDGRLTLADRPDAAFDLLVLDAFSSDSIPVHLLTVEATELYRSTLADGGVIAFHISNKHLDLRPVLAGIGAELGIPSAVRRDPDLTSGSWWFVLDPAGAYVTALAEDERWVNGDALPHRAWTDDRSDLLSVLGVDAP